MTTPEELEVEKDKTEGARVTFEFLRWLLQHSIVFKQTQANGDALNAYLKDANLGWTLPNLVAAYNKLVERGHRFELETLAPPTPVEKEEEPLPSVPGMGEPQIFTSYDIDSMPRERFNRLYFGPSKEQFRARIVEIKRREREEE